jgi:hypothetical protein
MLLSFIGLKIVLAAKEIVDMLFFLVVLMCKKYFLVVTLFNWMSKCAF